MARYYVNKNAQTGGEHEVHVYGCAWLPDSDNRIYLGDFSSCHPAVRATKNYYDKVDGCYFCCRPCHSG